MGSWQSAGAVSSRKVLGPVARGVESDLGDMQFCGAVTALFRAEAELSDEKFFGAVVAPSKTETELSDAQCGGAVASPSGTETVMKNAKFCGAGPVLSGTETGLTSSLSRGSTVASSGPLRCAGSGKGDACHLSRQRKGRCAVFVAGAGQLAR